MKSITHYFPNLSESQLSQFHQLEKVYSNWNQQINVISRKDMDSFYTNHVLHSLAIAKVIEFVPKTKVLDIGTGGGFPGIPLAIVFPEVQFHLVDSIGKKIKVVQEVAKELNLNNVTAEQIRAEQLKSQYDFIISRAVTQMPEFMVWTKGKFRKNKNNAFQNGIFYLKGGDLTEELATIKHKEFPISSFFTEEFFETKKVIYVKANG